MFIIQKCSQLLKAKLPNIEFIFKILEGAVVATIVFQLDINIQSNLSLRAPLYNKSLSIKDSIMCSFSYPESLTAHLSCIITYVVQIKAFLYDQYDRN